MITSRVYTGIPSNMFTPNRSAHRCLTAAGAEPAEEHCAALCSQPGVLPARRSVTSILVCDPVTRNPPIRRARLRRLNIRCSPPFLFRFALILLMLCAPGCRASSPRGQVSGTLTIGTTPLPGILVTFIAKSDQGVAGRAQGLTDASGKYVLRGEDQLPGAVIGDYVVVLKDMAIYDAPRDADGTVLKHPPRRFPAIYEHVETTPLKAQIAAGDQTIDFDIPSR